MTAGAVAPENASPEVPDVCLICEGTYPFIAGGVSSWVHDIIKGEPQVTFLVLNLGSYQGAYGPPKFKFPPNVTRFQQVFSQDAPAVPLEGAARAALERNIRNFRKLAGRRQAPSRLLAGLRRLHLDDTVDDALLADLATRDLTVTELLYSNQSFELVEEVAERVARKSSFMDLFWQMRSMNIPAVRLLSAQYEPAKAFHALSAGYAGLVGAVEGFRSGKPFLLTEHGIYSRERDIELSRADWIPDRAKIDPLEAAVPTFSPLRRLWARFFRRMSQVAYYQATRIVTLSEANRQKQIADGAPTPKTLVVPNGVERTPRPADAPPIEVRTDADLLRVGFVGRLVPIKDIMTMIRACAMALKEEPVDVRIIGPSDEDPEYASRCKQLVASLGCEGKIKFLGMQPIGQIYEQIDVLVMTSFSEGQPLVILEAFACGVPVICTDVGCCRELIEGGPKDRHLGPSGVVTRVAVPQDTARAIVTLARDRALLRRYGESARQRLLASYQRSTMLESYKALYAELA